MNLDPATLGFVFILTTVVLGSLLLFSWLLNRTIKALAWWSGAFFLTFFGMAFVSLGQGHPSMQVLLVANGFMALAYGSLYAGCRAFNGRSGLLVAATSGLGVWLLAFLIILNNASARLALMSAIAAVYSILSAWELWKHGPERLASQAVVVPLLIGLGIFNIFRGMLGFSVSSTLWISAFTQRWSSEMALVLVVYMPALAFVFLSMAKEKVEVGYKQAALVDPLTGLPNRRAFFKHASRLVKNSGPAPISCLLFDLDHFKSVNDRFGHDLGDHILTLFSQVLKRSLPKNSYGRLGGEEFAAIMPVPKPEAEALAEHVRATFAALAKTVKGAQTDGTVSIGCASLTNASVRQLLQEADIALYRAKANGRNAVAVFQPEDSPAVPSARLLSALHDPTDVSP
jgi:diguanylate cyclase (GGDEF)-like protein